MLKQFICKTLFVFLLLISGFDPCVYAQEIIRGGMFFPKSIDAPEDRPYLHITSEKLLPIQEKTEIKFSLAFKERGTFGHITDILVGNKTIRALYTNYHYSDTAKFFLVINNKTSDKYISIPAEKLTGGNWFDVNLIFSPADKTVKLIFDGKETTAHTEISRDAKADIYFGEHPNTNFYHAESPGFAIRNLRVFRNRVELIHRWPLTELEGNTARDIIGGMDADAVNAIWLMKYHYRFRIQAVAGPFLLDTTADRYTANPVYDTKRNSILFIADKYMIEYFLNSKKSVKTDFRRSFRTTKLSNYHFMYNKYRDELYAYHDGGGSLLKYDREKRMWDSLDYSLQFNDQYYGSEPIFNPADSGLYSLFGYGHYRHKNTLRKYDFISKKWNEVPLKGDKLPGMGSSVVIPLNENGEFIIVGGIGNESGWQHEQYRTIYDYFLLNLRDRTVKKLGSADPKGPKIVEGSITGVYSNYLKKILVINGNKYSGTQSIRGLDLRTGKVTIYGDSVFAGIYQNSLTGFSEWRPYDSANGELFIIQPVAASKDSFYARISTVLYPPLSREDYEKLEAKSRPPWYSNKYLLIFVFFSFLGGINFYYYNNYKKQKMKPGGGEEDAARRVRPGIYLFGDISVITPDGKNIALEFSPKITHIFLLLLIRTYSGDRRGIKTDEFTAEMWPELSPEQSKNNRNVSISKLRGHLAAMPGVEIVNEKNHLRLILPDDLYCDLTRFLKLTGNFRDTLKGIDEIKSILSRGQLLSRESFGWLDFWKQGIISEAITKLLRVINQENITPEERLAAADCILYLDSVSEKAVTVKIQMLIQLGLHSTAKKTYDIFAKEYYELYGEEYPRKMNELM